MSLVSNIFKNLNESAEAVKKPYGDTPQEGKKENLAKGKKKSVPKGNKVDNKKVPADKLQNNNKEAGEVYANGTAKYSDKVDDKSQSDKGKIAKKNTTKATTVIKFPYGDKAQAASTKLVKEEAEVKECGPELEPGKEKLAEDYDDGTWMKHQTAIENELEAAKEEMDEDAFFDFLDGVINLCQNYNGELNQFESAKVEECGAVEKKTK